jgi:hypothetical protein
MALGETTVTGGEFCPALLTPLETITGAGAAAVAVNITVATPLTETRTVTAPRVSPNVRATLAAPFKPVVTFAALSWALPLMTVNDTGMPGNSRLFPPVTRTTSGCGRRAPGSAVCRSPLTIINWLG